MKDEISPRVGVFICECGGKIADVLDTGTLLQLHWITQRSFMQPVRLTRAARMDSRACTKP